MVADAPPLDEWLAALGLEVVGGAETTDGALTRDVVLDGERRFDLRTTVAWIDGVGLSAWAYYGLEQMEIPKRVMAAFLRANYEYPFVKFALTDDDRPMLLVELPPSGCDQDALGRALTEIALVADRMLDETAPAIADRGVLPDWSGRLPRNTALLKAYRAEVESMLPPLPPAPDRPTPAKAGARRGGRSR